MGNGHADKSTAVLTVYMMRIESQDKDESLGLSLSLELRGLILRGPFRRAFIRFRQVSHDLGKEGLCEKLSCLSL